ncbi:hypothetical protein [Trichothermofontia sp.]
MKRGFWVRGAIALGAIGMLATPNIARPATALMTQSSTTTIAQARSNRRTALPRSLQNDILQDMSRRTLLPVSQLRIMRVDADTFDGCLGVAPRDGACTMIALPGWRVAVAGGQFYWFYHATTSQGFKLNGFTSVPIAITRAALRDAAQRSRLSVGQLQVNWVEQKTWSNGCFDLPTGGVCTSAMVPGWQVTIAHQQKRWVYRTDSGNTVQFDRAASRL